MYFSNVGLIPVELLFVDVIRFNRVTIEVKQHHVASSKQVIS